jgi:hypothetical protein
MASWALFLARWTVTFDLPRSPLIFGPSAGG